ncbi:hypothetical protein H012_gp669 [Acanthamoeba polyphaga moumouvirus]|uniref:Uncharacterized protein n=1 Tax=Acanthamoeba polyphaga moumouvirus TaxID=1269028 RepID=L7RC57_9VIRU|nr:hypothetical protein H012_gp669 [Acanthamoeba polyphaga moumouvirus]AGC01796.1 hypothetical protein Moumou_00252 [Acanthamoeba polyphaga moumouvirus]
MRRVNNYFSKPGIYTTNYSFTAYAPIRCIPLYILSQLNLHKRYDKYEKEVFEAIANVEIFPGTKIVKPSNFKFPIRCNQAKFTKILRFDTLSELDKYGYLCESGNSTFLYKNNKEIIKIDNFDTDINSLKAEGLVIAQTLEECVKFFDTQ